MPPQPTARVPLDEQWEWQVDGACREADPSLFFHPRNERGLGRAQRDRAALHVCARCPVVARCRDYAMRSREPHGIWGGLTEDDREVLLRRSDAEAGAEQEVRAS